MTLMLMIATLAVLTFLGLSCRRARLDLEEELCECLQTPVAAAVGFGPTRVEAAPVLTGIDGGRSTRAPGRRGGGRHLRVVECR